MSKDAPLPEGNTSGSAEGSMLDAWESHLALPLEGSREAYNPHQAVYLIVVV